MHQSVRSPLVALLLVTSAARPASAQTGLPPFCTEGALPSGDPKYPSAQLILTCIPPAAWNGHLVVYAHGYVLPQLPLALPFDELTLPDSTGTPVFLPSMLLEQGFAFATSSYHKNGYAIEQAGNDLLTLVEYFKAIAPGPVDKVLIVGASEGGLITTMLVEKHPEVFAGGLALCGPVGGMPFQLKYLGDFPVVFNYFFPDVFPFGVAHPPVPELSLDTWRSVYVPRIAEALSAPEATDTREQLFRVTHVARDPSDLLGSSVSSAVQVLNYFGLGTPDLIATAGGMPYDNRFTFYFGSNNDLKLNIGVERVQGSPLAMQYVRRFYQTTGKLQRPLVTLHTTLDPQVPYAQEIIYFFLTALAGRSAHLTQIAVPAYGHCAFTADQISEGFGLLVAKSAN